MKKLFALTTSLCAAACAIGFGGTAAFADASDGSSAGIDYYPADFTETFTFDSLDDYAVGDGSYAFLQANRIYTYDGERLSDPFENSSEEITGVYYQGGAFLYGTRTEKFYNLEDGTEVAGFTDATPKDNVHLNGYLYYYGNEKLYALDKSSETQQGVLLDGYYNLKQFGNMAYAVKDNVLYVLNGIETQPVAVNYLNFKIAETILVGNAAEVLKEYNENGPSFVTLTDKTHLTEVDLSVLNGEFFKTGETYTVGKNFKATSALLLGKTGKDGGISIVSVNGTSYLIGTDNAKLLTTRTPLTDSGFTHATTRFNGYLYSSPYENTGTSIKELKSGTVLKILKEVKKDGNSELQYDVFYQVEYEFTEGEETLKLYGYVPQGLVTTLTFHEAPPTTTADPGETYDDLVKPVILVLVVLLLAFIAIGYLIFVGTNGKRKNRKTKSVQNGEQKKQN